MASVDIPVLDWVWCAKVGSSNYGNTGVRLQSGKKVTSGSVTWIGRSVISFDRTLVPAGAFVTAAELRMTVRGTHSCFSLGGSPLVWVQRATAYGTIFNGNTGECSAGLGSGGQMNWPGPTVTPTHRAGWGASSAPSPGDLITFDVIMLWNDETVPDLIVFTLSADDETDASQAIAFDGGSAANPPVLRVTYSTNTVPDVSSNAGRLPANAARNTPTVLQTFKGTYVDADDNPAGLGPATVQVQVANDSGFSSIVHDVTAAPTAYNTSTKVWTATRTITLTRGNTYYWRYKLTDQSSGVSAWSSTWSFIVNRLPTNTKVRPT